MLAMNAERLAQRLLDLDLITPQELQDVWGLFGRRNIEGEEFLKALVRREILTNWQVDRLHKGDNTGFFYGDYKVLYLVGAGTFARVYRAVNKDDPSQVVALKVLRNRFSEDPEKKEHFLQEGGMGLELRHPNIVPITHVSSQRNVHYLTMEFVEGGSLREFVRLRGRIPPEESTRLIMDVTNGIRYAWQKGISHRDLKMTNVLVSSSGTAKVVDFGLAAGHSGEGKIRTVDYAGLEKASGAKKDDIRSDIFFLGCIYYNMLAGVPPLSHTRDRAERIAKQRFLNITPINQVVSDLPAAVVAVVNRAIELKPEKRYQTPSEMLIELRHLYERIEGKEFQFKERADAAAAVGNKSSVMIVEANSELQDKLREAFKGFGYRVMLTRDAGRAMDRFYDPNNIPDGLILDAESTGRAALDVFNQFAKENRTRELPAVLLLSEEQRPWANEADVNEHRRVLFTPIKLKNLRDTFESLQGHGPEGEG